LLHWHRRSRRYAQGNPRDGLLDQVRKGLAHKSRTPRKASGSKRDLVRAIPVFGKERQVRARPFRAGPYARRKRRSPNPASGFRPKVTVPRANAGSRMCFLRLLNFTSRPLRRIAQSFFRFGFPRWRAEPPETKRSLGPGLVRLNSGVIEHQHVNCNAKNPVPVFSGAIPHPITGRAKP
jgi:hypothetical protein